MVLTISTSNIAGVLHEFEGKRRKRVVTLSVTGDGSAASGTMSALWWKAHGFSKLDRVEFLEPLTEATPDEDEYYMFKFSSDFLTLYIGDNHAGSPMTNLDVHTAKIKLVGY